MVIEGNWIVGAMAQDFPDVNWAVAELPEGSAGRATYAFTVCYGVAAESPNPEAVVGRRSTSSPGPRAPRRGPRSST